MKNRRRRIETKTSKVALMICVTRAASFYEIRKQYQSGDHIAPLFLPPFVRALLKTKLARKILTEKIIPRGLYEYAIARTKYIDSVFQSSIQDGFRQVVILGSGFDSRGIRFQNPDSAIKIFELDAPVTQNDKIRRLKKRVIRVPDTVRFVPIDFDRESTADALARSGFEKGTKTLFLMEGLLMYLSVRAVNSIFQFLQSSSGRGSEVVFDYVNGSALREENRNRGEEEAYQYVEKAGESLHSGFENRELGNFLTGYGFSIEENLDSDKLNGMYFNRENGDRPGAVIEVLCMVRARKV
jgi:methyltransferase (TIGR00027 family)